MSPLFMTILLVAAFGLFAWTARRRWKLMTMGPPVDRFDQLGRRLGLALRYAFGQARMPRYRGSGLAHILVFSGFLVLLLRSIILWGRGYSEGFSLWVFGSSQPLGVVYGAVKDTFVLLVLIGVLVFLYYRVIRKLPRLTLNAEGLLILAIIFTMMIADVLYDAALAARTGEFYKAEYLGCLVGGWIRGLSPEVLRVLEHVGLWTHVSLVLIFLNLLPYGKHFHVITAIPNVFTASLQPSGRLAPVDDMEGRIEREETLGVAAIDDLHWKSILDLYTCTECGRCSDNCPATRTGKQLSPKHLTIALRDHAYKRQAEVLALRGNGDRLERQPLVSENLIKPEVIWACTSCRACEEECPVFITYVDKIVDMRRHLVMEQADFPDELQNAFRGLETTGNPWSYPPDDRVAWAEGLEVPLISDHGEAELLFWVGCAGAFDQRARKITIATANLLLRAGVDFAILGPEETCTGDVARRAGNEFLFQMMAEQNCETLNGYGVKRILTTCPHCFNTLANDYPDFGGRFEVVNHTDLLLDLVRGGRLRPQHEVRAAVTYHDSCYLGRYNGVYDSPRGILESIPGVRLIEPEATRDRGMCCGAGGAQMFKEEEPGEGRVNHLRTDQLLAPLDGSSGSDDLRVISSACPFCMRMLTDGLADKERTEVEQLDVAEVLWRAITND